MYKFTFKKHSHHGTLVKFHKEIIGELFAVCDEETWEYHWKLRLKMNTCESNDNCPWRWVTMKTDAFSSEQEGRVYITKNAQTIYENIADVFKEGVRCAGRNNFLD